MVDKQLKKKLIRDNLQHSQRQRIERDLARLRRRVWFKPARDLLFLLLIIAFTLAVLAWIVGKNA